MSARKLRMLAVCAAITLATAAGFGSSGSAASAQPYPGDGGDNAESEELLGDVEVSPELPSDRDDTAVHPDTLTGPVATATWGAPYPACLRPAEVAVDASARRPRHHSA